MKKYVVKVYDENGLYLTNWEDVSSPIYFVNEINSVGGQMKFVLARNAGDYGEGSDVDFGHNVRVYVFDKEQPDGIIIFQGFISSYTPIYKNDSVEVIVLSYGERLNSTLIEDVPAPDVSVSTTDGNVYSSYYFNTYDYYITGQSWTTGSNQFLNSVNAKLAKYTDNENLIQDVYMYVYSQVPVLATTSSTAPGSTANPFADTYLVATSNKVSLDSTTVAEHEFTFPEPPEFASGATPFFLIIPSTMTSFLKDNSIRIATNTTNVYANGSGYRSTYATGPLRLNEFVAITGDRYFITNVNSGDTSVPFLSVDPSTIMEGVIDANIRAGGVVTYSDDSIDLTATTVSYTFNVNTVLEGVRKCLELAPENWYWYIDYATGYLHFHEKSGTPDHQFSLERDIIDARFEKRVEEIVNVIYFTGGDTGGGVNFYKKYTIPASIAKYGARAMKYSDQRVILTATADTIANSILATRSEPELRVTLEILDSNNEQGVGYDIESINVGDVVAVRNVSQTVGLSSWDVARWDDGYFDFNIYNLSSLVMQVQRLEYNEGSVKLYASTIATDVNKRIEDINRNLEALQTAQNPTTPT
jgi:hypothetical protein